MTQLTGTLYTIAKDVKIQVEFNPSVIKAYRLIGYENRKMNNEDFKDDTKDAGELGPGHTVTALYEIIPYGSKTELPEADKIKDQNAAVEPNSLKTGEMMAVRLRYKEPDGNESKLIENIITDQDKPLEQSSNNFRFSAAVVEFSMLLRDSKFKGNSSYKHIIELSGNSKGDDKYGYREEFIKIVEKCELIK